MGNVDEKEIGMAKISESQNARSELQKETKGYAYDVATKYLHILGVLKIEGMTGKELVRFIHKFFEHVRIFGDEV